MPSPATATARTPTVANTERRQPRARRPALRLAPRALESVDIGLRGLVDRRDLGGFEHVAFFDEENEWIDIRLRSLAEQFIDLTELDMRTHFARNEEMRTEISTKFTRERLEASYADAGLELVEWWTDPDELYALSLARPVT